jgi:methylmalonyl-CoA mutase N-terminal domain/subunit
VQNDVLKEYIARGTYIYPAPQSLRLITDIFKYCKTEVPGWNTISISGYHIREAGSTAAQELAFTLANGITYVQAALDAGLDVDEFASRLSFFFNVHNNFFEEIAKFRAARRIWAHIMRDRFKAKSPKSWVLRFHSQTAGCSLTAQQPDNNVVRVAVQALAAVLGGTQSLHTNSKDEALGLPTESAVTLALRTQQVIAHESGVAQTVDPLGGSYFVESLTGTLEKEALAYIKRIEDLGGVLRCIETGFIQKEIQNSSYAFQLAVESKKEIIVGVNEFLENQGTASRLNSSGKGSGRKAKPNSSRGAEKLEVLRVDPALEKAQIQRLIKFKKSRKTTTVEGHLEKIRNAAATTNTNLMPLFVEALSDKVTLGEISHALRDVFGLYKENIVI